MAHHHTSRSIVSVLAPGLDVASVEVFSSTAFDATLRPQTRLLLPNCRVFGCAFTELTPTGTPCCPPLLQLDEVSTQPRPAEALARGHDVTRNQTEGSGTTSAWIPCIAIITTRNAKRGRWRTCYANCTFNFWRKSTGYRNLWAAVTDCQSRASLLVSEVHNRHGPILESGASLPGARRTVE